MSVPLWLGHAFVQRERTSFVALIPNEAKDRSCAVCGQFESAHLPAPPEPPPVTLIEHEYESFPCVAYGCSAHEDRCNAGIVIGRLYCPCEKPRREHRSSVVAQQEMPERIVAAAIRQDGVVYTGPHHHQIIRYMVPMLKLKTVTGEQGFVTSLGRYVSRELGAYIAAKAGQVSEERDTLFSEQLWNVSDYSMWGQPEPPKVEAQAPCEQCGMRADPGWASNLCPYCEHVMGVEPPQPEAQELEPIPMILHCPCCHLQHIDKPSPERNWKNPPHRSHECQGCGFVWRPADVATAGVASIRTRGRLDGELAQPEGGKG